MVVAVVAAPVSSLLTHSFATGEAHARFPSAAASHANWTAIRADPRCARSASGRTIGCTGVALHRNDAQQPGTGAPQLRSRLALALAARREAAAAMDRLLG